MHIRMDRWIVLYEIYLSRFIFWPNLSINADYAAVLSLDSFREMEGSKMNLK